MPEYFSYDNEKQIIRVDCVGSSQINLWNDSLAKVNFIRSKNIVYGVPVNALKQKIVSDYQSVIEFSMLISKDLPFAVIIPVNTMKNETDKTTLSRQVFLENASQLSGSKVQLFIDEDAAIECLLREPVIKETKVH